MAFTEGGSVFDSKKKTLDYNPREGVRVNDGSIQSPALGFGHEIAHAARAFTDPEGFAKDNQPSSSEVRIEPSNDPNVIGTIYIEYGVTAEDVRVMELEGAMATELGEPTRASHDEGTYVEAPSPVYSCIVGADRPCP